VALDSAGGNLYISEFSGHRIRLVTGRWNDLDTGRNANGADRHGEEIAATLSELAYPAGL